MGVWLVWGVASVVVIGCGLWLTRRWKPLWLRDLVRALAIVTLLVPVTTGSEDGHFAPAYLVMFFEAVLQETGDPVPALVALVLGWGVAVLAVLALFVGRRVRASG